MSLRILSARVARPFMPASPIAWASFRAYTKKYTESHEWVSVENGVGTLGLTDHAQKNLGDIVYIETPSVGDKVDAGSPVGTVESVKAASDIYSPLSGEIVEVNESLADQPELINESPEYDGWLAKIKLSKIEELDDLLDEDAYKALTESSD